MKSIKEEARSVGLTLDQLAALVGVNRATLHRWHKQGSRLKQYKKESVRRVIADIRSKRSEE